ncbi:YjbF family lipoprotein [Salinisphaera sp.]|uniref:YjbF family lipoprotein n=1 Tax=Salinisphaera sp. TaxID=1914330 RepID=UPI000C520C80|nr:YjbF family lipoprotein [Salinisphaera sp.]MAS08587.1 hypothetical protein [Salinisphaera sp.]|tara:strand:- start:3663 stop:4373 length:711 start_codon:yes stop_codon:yes gene_type:complete
MLRSRFSRVKKGRRKAALLCVGGICAAASACSHINANDHPLLATTAALWPFGSSDVSGRAEKISYATIKFTQNNRGGLLVLAEQQPGVTYWQSGRSETVVLSRGYLSSTSGLQNNLEMTDVTGLAQEPDQSSLFVGPLNEPRHYRVTRQWQNADSSRRHTMSATATLSCAAEPEVLELPLARLPLLRCDETLDWIGAGTTRSVYWLAPDTHRIWKGQTEPWPGSPSFAWSVARPWW